ncbi:NADH:flavin oxidoreductase/NADH oxidase [Planctomicrobium sp. SH668]|uniref:NADH:flavin oxidoreductase/NADH oxidase n=1 Tax=Planctomicrobium sp. SH668 TaxID=3448126 RepID=UPI003F5C9DCE
MAKLFDEYQLKDVTLRNRIGVAPMCQYSAIDGFVNDWHYVHLGSRAVGGSALVIVEATGVAAEGRISPNCTGIYYEEHVNAFAPIVKLIKDHGSVPGIQIAHAGRKGSAAAPWLGDHHLKEEEGGWETIAPSPVAFGENLWKVPREMTHEDIRQTQSDFVVAAQRALAAGFEWLELHFAHGYLAHEFYSPLSNFRKDEYGGSFENRIRFIMETFEAVRKVWPERYPLTARLSVTDWNESGVTVDESIELVKRLKAAGLDMIDVSHGFVVPGVSQIPWGPGFLIPTASRIRNEADIPTASGWMLTEPQQAEQALQNGDLDIVLLARELLRDPHWPYRAAMELKDTRLEEVLPIQYRRAVRER